MKEIEELIKAPMEDWFTTHEAKERFGVPAYMVYRWGPRLEAVGLARKVGSSNRDRSLWLVTMTAIRFLQSRKGKVGAPKRRGRLNEVRSYVLAYIKKAGYSPTLTEIAEGCDLSSKSHAGYYVDLLIQRGVLSPGKRNSPRGLTIQEV